MAQVKCPQCGRVRLVVEGKRKKCRKCGTPLTADMAKKVETKTVTEKPDLPVDPATAQASAETSEQVDDTIDKPVDELVKEPIDETVDEPVDELVKEPIDETVDKPVDEAADEAADGLEMELAAMSRDRLRERARELEITLPFVITNEGIRSLIRAKLN